MLKSLLPYLMVLVALACFPAAADPSVVRVHFIAVGHGDAILIEQEQAAIALVDAGPPDCAAVVLNYLRGRGHLSLAHLFITHPHDDHIGGVPLLLDSMNIGLIHVTGMVERHESAESLDRRLQSGSWVVDTLGAGDFPVKNSDLRIEVLSPQANEAAGREANPNANSMVLRIQHDSVRVLLSADIDRDREVRLVQQYGPRLQSQALKASHHASFSGNGSEILKAVNPEIVVVTVGPSKWGYPSSETMKRLHEFCPTVLRTDSVGTVILQSDGKTIQVWTERGN
jgi:competence protein ComEC